MNTVSRVSFTNGIEKEKNSRNVLKSEDGPSICIMKDATVSATLQQMKLVFLYSEVDLFAVRAPLAVVPMLHMCQW